MGRNGSRSFYSNPLPSPGCRRKKGLAPWPEPPTAISQWQVETSNQTPISTEGEVFEFSSGWVHDAFGFSRISDGTGLSIKSSEGSVEETGSYPGLTSQRMRLYWVPFLASIY